MYFDYRYEMWGVSGLLSMLLGLTALGLLRPGYEYILNDTMIMRVIATTSAVRSAERPLVIYKSITLT